MNSHDVTLAGYALFASAGVGLEALAHRRRSRLPSLGDILTRVMRTRSGRVGVVTGWAWIGLHFFAR